MNLTTAQIDQIAKTLYCTDYCADPESTEWESESSHRKIAYQNMAASIVPVISSFRQDAA